MRAAAKKRQLEEEATKLESKGAKKTKGNKAKSKGKGRNVKEEDEDKQYKDNQSEEDRESQAGETSGRGGRGRGRARGGKGRGKGRGRSLASRETKTDKTDDSKGAASPEKEIKQEKTPPEIQDKSTEAGWWLLFLFMLSMNITPNFDAVAASCLLYVLDCTWPPHLDLISF